MDGLNRAKGIVATLNGTHDVKRLTHGKLF